MHQGIGDRNLTPGLRLPPLDTSHCRQLTEHFVESTAVHSRSKGWLPRIKLDLHHRPLIGPGPVEVLELIISPDDLRQLRLVMNAAMDRAAEDAARGIVEGLYDPNTLKED
jgi:hypothetical protein